MRRGKIFFYLAFILIMSLVAVAVVYVRFIQPGASAAGQLEAAPAVEMVNVLIATQKIARGNIVEGNTLGMVSIPKDVFIDGYFQNFEEVVGKRARVDLEANMILTSGMIAEDGALLSATGSNAALSIPKGLVAVSIPVDRLASVSYAPQPGDHVNVIVTLLFVDLDTDFQTVLPNTTAMVIAPGPAAEGSPGTMTANTVSTGEGNYYGRLTRESVLDTTMYVIPSEDQRPRLVSQTLLQDAVVLQFGNFATGEEEPEVPAETAAPAEGQVTPEPVVPEDNTAPQLPDVITLIVTPQDAVTLNYLIYSGARLTLALRSTGDDSRMETEATTLDYLLNQYNIPVPNKLPYGMEPRVDGFDEAVLPEPTPSPEE